MPSRYATSETIRALSEIFEKHKNERICVIGTMCCGKTTLIQQLRGYHCVDADDEFWPQISKKDTERLSQKPITEEIIGTVCERMREKITVKPGVPLFGITILDCEVVVYLDIAEQLLEKHCKQRGDTTFMDALFVKKYIEKHWNNDKARSKKIFYDLMATE